MLSGARCMMLNWINANILYRRKLQSQSRMEGEALIAAMDVSEGQSVTINTDSEFWINVLTKWAPGWKAKGWKKKSGPIKNLDLVQKALELYEASEAKLIWVRAHVGTDGNELADEWANKARLEKINL